ncbi:ATP-binding protein [Geminisphaera colitermitum]|uniref:ATP-binding protein n=1 Tax=Geminisphaera colitermitum TaxID=1148786 RepID=UPI000158CD5A|nr:ATP-binding protein [Geminisphaera colitermitum]
MEVCYVPTLSAHSADCRRLFDLWRCYGRNTVHVTLDFSYCDFLRPQAVAFLGGLVRLIEHRGGSVSFLWGTLKPAIWACLAQNGFMQAFGGPQGPWQGTAVPYLEHRAADAAAFDAYARGRWLGRGWVDVSPELVSEVVGNVGEIYVNAFEHADSAVGVHGCGQLFPKLGILSLTLVDFGVGIPANVRRFHGAATGEVWRDGRRCLEWAFARGNSTRSGPVSGGLGLDTLREFVVASQGSLEIHSHESRAILRKERTEYAVFPDYFEGTMITIRLRSSPGYYDLGSSRATFHPF